MPSIIAYTYEAATHCPDCARSRFSFAKACRASPGALNRDDCDENGVDATAEDREGNAVYPVFTTDETCADLPLGYGGDTLSCNTCGLVIKQHYARKGLTNANT